MQEVIRRSRAIGLGAACIFDLTGVLVYAICGVPWLPHNRLDLCSSRSGCLRAQSPMPTGKRSEASRDHLTRFIACVRCRSVAPRS